MNDLNFKLQSTKCNFLGPDTELDKRLATGGVGEAAEEQYICYRDRQRKLKTDAKLMKHCRRKL